MGLNEVELSRHLHVIPKIAITDEISLVLLPNFYEGLTTIGKSEFSLYSICFKQCFFGIDR